MNTAGWDKAWTNLVNDVEQTFTPSLTRLTGVEVELVVGNAGPAKDQVTLTVLDATGQTRAVMTQSVPTADCDQVMFVIPKGGVEVTPGQTYRLKLSGNTLVVPGRALPGGQAQRLSPCAVQRIFSWVRRVVGCR